MNVLTAVLALVGNLFYVVVYTGLSEALDRPEHRHRRRRRPCRRSSATRRRPAAWRPGLWLFLIVFLWTPPHFWALALMIKDHYAAAGVPMLPGTRGDRETTPPDPPLLGRARGVHARRRLWLGWLYTVAAAVLGGYFLLLANRLRARCGRGNAAVLFHYSLAYLALLFVAAASTLLMV